MIQLDIILKIIYLGWIYEVIMFGRNFCPDKK